jgi:hypothetical protein
MAMGPEAVPARQVEQAVAPAAAEVPSAQGEQAAAPALAEKLPAGQTVQALASATAENVPALQSVQLPFADPVQAVARRVPGWQIVQATHVFPWRYRPGGQLRQAVAAGPLQVAQVASQVVQIRSAVARQGALSWLPAGHVARQARHWVPSKKAPPPHIEQAESPAFVQVTVAAQPATGVHAAQPSAVPLIRWVPALQLPHC